MSHLPHADTIASARRALDQADALLITAGAGMGVDSGLPDFRGDEGFWRAYPRFAQLGLRLVDLANAEWFQHDPELAWGFYGDRLNLYRATPPHRGFGRLLEFGARLPGGVQVYTSNVDGHFQTVGYDELRICEVHGSLRHFQCLDYHCGSGIWPAPAAPIAVDDATLRASGPLPSCPKCGRVARPNVLLFKDGEWIESRSLAQEQRLRAWLDTQTARLVIIEFGAGMGIPTVRRYSRHAVDTTGGTLIRVNPREPEAPAGTLSLAIGALDAIDQLLP